MAKSETSDSSETSSAETEAPKKSDSVIRKKMKEGMSDYEMQRTKRMEENRARMEALGLKKMAKSLMGSAQDVKERKRNENKGKRKVDDDDDEYRPAEDEELQGMSSSDEDRDSDGDDEDEEEFKVSQKNKGKKKTTTPKKSSAKKRVPKQKPFGYSDYVDDDDALLQAIALSLQDSAGFLNVKPQVSQNSTAQVIESSSNEKEGSSQQVQTSTSQVIEASSNEKKGNSQIEQDTGKRKRKKMGTSRVQMTEDEVILHFFQFDEAGKGNITLRDVQRLAAAHDFMWSDKEMADMINCFDGDGDGKLKLEDFREIVGQCNMIQIPDNKTS